MIKALTGATETEEKRSGARINRATALSLVQHYKNTQHSILKTAGLDNTVYAWFSIAALKTFLEDLITCQASGVRVYFGAINAPGTPKHDKQTVVFVCTSQTENPACHVELIDNDSDTVEDGYDFGSLCPPECNHCACAESSIARDVFGDAPCPKP
jgi:hypothetical protein